MKPGIINASIAFFLWGVSPLFWKQLQSMPFYELISWRILCTFLWAIVIISTQRKIIQLKVPAFLLRKLLLSSLLIGTNWFAFIYAVNSNNVLAVSLGYFMGPILSFFIGLTFLKEIISKLQLLTLILFLIALIVLSRNTGIPWISVSLALSFSLYGLVKKKILLIPQVTLFYETLFVVPFCLWYLFSLENFALNTLTPYQIFFFIFMGLYTYLPLHFFSKAAQQMPLTILGVLQYIAPLGQFIIGCFWYKEPFNNYQLLAYTFVWLGIILFTTLPLISKLKPNEDVRNIH